MREDEEEYEVVIEERGGFGTFLLGALFGAGVALLLAPRNGRETQAELARALGGVRERAGGPVDGTRQSVAGLVSRARGGLTGRLDEVRAAVDDRMDRVRGAVDEGRMAATQARVELRRRVDEAKAAYRTNRGPAPSGPRVLRAETQAEAPAAEKAEEVVITETTVERDAGDLAR
ncbi:MAG TPA: YtxH domain-containing protein [Longimicrobium sp.]|nr:YtxH domain-containing protein [Longimicrobium sp.]